jgi:hypothetical protein
MFAIAIAAVVVYAVFTGVVGMRLLLLARRTHALPETALGISYTLGGMLGWAAIVVGTAFAERSPTAGLTLQFLGLLCLSAGHLSTALFSWRVFNPDSAWARALFSVLLVTAIVEYFHNVVQLGVIFPPPSSFWYWPGACWRTGTYVWMPFVALRYDRRLHLRLALGLADPVATNRVLLWGLIGVLTLATSVGVIVATLLGLWTSSSAPAVLMITTVSSAIASILGIFAFSPPARYLDWVKARAPRVE